MKTVSFEADFSPNLVIGINPDRLYDDIHQFYVKLNPAQELKYLLSIDKVYAVGSPQYSVYESLVRQDALKSISRVFIELRSLIFFNIPEQTRFGFQISPAQGSKMKGYLKRTLLKSRLVFDEDVLRRWDDPQFFEWNSDMVRETVEYLQGLPFVWTGSFTKRRSLETFCKHFSSLGGTTFANIYVLSHKKVPKHVIQHIRQRLGLA